MWESLRALDHRTQGWEKVSGDELTAMSARIDRLEAVKGQLPTSDLGQMATIAELGNLRQEMEKINRLGQVESAQFSVEVGMLNERICKMGAWQNRVDERLTLTEKKYLNSRLQCLLTWSRNGWLYVNRQICSVICSTKSWSGKIQRELLPANRR